jgi:hypothetical protein
MTHDDMRLLADLSEKVARDIERLNKIEHGEKYVLQVAEVQAVVQQITLIINQEVSDEHVIERVAERLQQLSMTGGCFISVRSETNSCKKHFIDGAILSEIFYLEINGCCFGVCMC